MSGVVESRRAGGAVGDRPGVAVPGGQVGCVPPDRSLAQRMQALGNANEIRSRRAQLKRDVKAGRVGLADVLLAPEAWVETMKVWDLLVTVPKYGRVKVNRILVQGRISPSKTIGGLSPRQRCELVSLVVR